MLSVDSEMMAYNLSKPFIFVCLNYYGDLPSDLLNPDPHHVSHLDVSDMKNLYKAEGSIRMAYEYMEFTEKDKEEYEEMVKKLHDKEFKNRVISKTEVKKEQTIKNNYVKNTNR